MDPSKSVRSERQPLSKPQIYVNLEFGMSWSARHTPRTHTMTYMSRNLKNSRDRGNFPRQVPPPSTNYLAAPEQPAERPREKPNRHLHPNHASRHQPQYPPQNHQIIEYYAPRAQPRHQPRQQQPHGDPRQRTQAPLTDRRESRAESRGSSSGRGRSAPPPVNSSPWDAETGASLLSPWAPSATYMGGEEPHVWKALPESPAKFRLGEEGMPWSAWSWPLEPEGSAAEQESNSPLLVQHPTTVAIAPERRREVDPDRMRELETLSTAMMTVDNGFEDQWWNQGTRQVVTFVPVDAEEPRSMSIDATLMPPAQDRSDYAESVIDEWLHQTAAATQVSPATPALHNLVSPVSDSSTPINRNLHRSLTTRSEELFIGVR